MGTLLVEVAGRHDPTDSLQPPPMVLPLVGDRVAAGFPSPAEDFNTKRIDLTERLIVHPQATFLLRVSGDSMRDAGIFDGGCSCGGQGHPAAAPAHRSRRGRWRIHRQVPAQAAGQVRLAAANPTYPDIIPREGQVIEVWGVVTGAIKQFPA